MTRTAIPIPIPIFAPVESAPFDAVGSNVRVGDGVRDVDVVDELGAELSALGLGGRLTAAFPGHTAAVLLTVYFAELMLEGETVAIWLKTF